MPGYPGRHQQGSSCVDHAPPAGPELKLLRQHLPRILHPVVHHPPNLCRTVGPLLLQALLLLGWRLLLLLLPCWLLAGISGGGAAVSSGALAGPCNPGVVSPQQSAAQPLGIHQCQCLLADLSSDLQQQQQQQQQQQLVQRVSMSTVEGHRWAC